MVKIYNCLYKTQTAVIVFASLFANLAYADTPPDAGSIRRGIESDLKQFVIPLSLPNVETELQSEVKPGGVQFTLTSVVVSGNSALSDEEVNVVAKPYLNHPIDFSQIQAMTYAIEVAYRATNHVARVLIPEQNLENGLLKIKIEEAVFGQPLIKGSSSSISNQKLIEIITARQPAGVIIDTRNLDRGLLLANDIPGIYVEGYLSQGKQALVTNVNVSVEDKPKFFGDLMTDNSGSKSTGTPKLVGNIGLNSPLGLGDLLAGTFLHSDGTDYGRASYSIPVGKNGVRVGINGSLMSYNLVSPEFSALNATGTFSSYGFEASYPIIRERNANLYISTNADIHQFSNSQRGESQSNYKTTDYTATLYGNLFDKALGGGVNNGSIAIVTGDVNLNNSPNLQRVKATNNAQGKFTKLRYYASRSQAIADGLSGYVSLTGQATNDNLDSSEKFYLGGPNGVRAYPVNEGGGSQGQIVTVELRQAMHSNLLLSAFYDYGHIQDNPHNNFAGAPLINQYDLKGVGVAVAWQPSPKLTIKATLARRIGSNPDATIKGSDQDGTLIKNRLWVMANFSF